MGKFLISEVNFNIDTSVNEKFHVITLSEAFRKIFITLILGNFLSFIIFSYEITLFNLLKRKTTSVLKTNYITINVKEKGSILISYNFKENMP